MGLDISHAIPSVKNSNVEELDYFTIKELSINRGLLSGTAIFWSKGKMSLEKLKFYTSQKKDIREKA